jgi:transposase
MTTLTGNRLPEWIEAVHAARLPGLSTFAEGLRADLVAVVNALALPFSDGPTEGPVTRLRH